MTLEDFIRQIIETHGGGIMLSTLLCFIEGNVTHREFLIKEKRDIHGQIVDLGPDITSMTYVEDTLSALCRIPELKRLSYKRDGKSVTYLYIES